MDRIFYYFNANTDRMELMNFLNIMVFFFKFILFLISAYEVQLM